MLCTCMGKWELVRANEFLKGGVVKDLYVLGAMEPPFFGGGGGVANFNILISHISHKNLIWKLEYGGTFADYWLVKYLWKKKKK